MADVLTSLENELDKLYGTRLEMLGHGQYVPDWNDYNFRIGYLQCIREIGELVKKLRNPEAPAETGEIPDILTEAKAEEERLNG